MNVIKGILVIGALAVGVLVVSNVVTGASTKKAGAGGVFGSLSGGIGSAVGGAKALSPIYNYNFPEFTFPSMPVLEMPEALVNQVKNETTMPTQPTETKKSSKAVSGDTFVWGGETFQKQKAVSGVPYQAKPTQPSLGMTKKQALFHKLDAEDDKTFFGSYGGFFGGV